MRPKIREFPGANYKAFYIDGKTYRFYIDGSKSMVAPKFPEFYDIKLTSKCDGQCPWCYMDSTPDSEHATNAIVKITEYFGAMTLNERPFQVALGGGEPTLHPRFTEILESFTALGITPNYTTNGMTMDDSLAQISKRLCGGVAISCHSHLDKYWRKAHKLLTKHNIDTNFHVIISDRVSVNTFLDIWREFRGKVDHFVLLPYSATGRATEKEIDFDYLFASVAPQKDVAFGAGFHNELEKRKIKVSLYDPEMFSAFLDLADMKLYKSSFDLTERT